MKSIDVLIQALMSEAHETAEKLIQNAKKTTQDVMEKQRKKGKERARDRIISIENKAQNDSVIIKLRNTAAAESKANWLILETKQTLIDNVLTQVKEGLLTMIKTDEYINVLEDLIVEGGIIVGEPDLKVILNERDSNIPLDLDKLSGIISKKTGLKVKITKSAKKIDVIGGPIIQSIDGKVVMNNTFEGMLNYSESEIRFKIAQILFP